MRRKPNSTIVIIICGLAMLSLLSCSVGRAIVKGPQSPTATPTATHRPTFTATISPTPKPTATATQQPTPTSPASPTPAAAGAAAPSNTLFVAMTVGGLSDCDATGVFGFTHDANEVFVKDAHINNSTEAPSPVVNANSTQRCEGDGANPWTKADFTKQL
jgi:hypothetical protein